MSNRTRFAGQYRAVEFNYGGIGVDYPPALVVATAPGASGSQTLTVYGGTITLTDGTIVSVFNTNALVSVVNASGSDTQTPSAVSTYVQSNLYGATATVTATWTYAHYAGDRVSSGTVGLQEAINYVNAKGGGTVIVDNEWVTQGGTQAILGAAVVPSTVTIVDNRTGGFAPVQTLAVALTLAQILAANTTPVLIVPAPGAGNLVDVIDAELDLIYGSAAYSGGGAAGLYYGNANLTYPATATTASTVFTGLSANTIAKMVGVSFADASSNVLNAGVYYSNASAVFTGGTGGSGILVVNYRVVTGLK